MNNYLQVLVHTLTPTTHYPPHLTHHTTTPMFGLGKYGGAVLRLGKQTGAIDKIKSSGIVDKARDYAQKKAMSYVTQKLGKGNVDKLAALTQTQAGQYATKWAKGKTTQHAQQSSFGRRWLMG